MVTRSQKIRLGIFVASGVFLIIATLIIIVAPKFFQDRDNYFIGYRGVSLTGLQQGSAVKYHGLTVGYVSDIFIDVKDIERVIVEVSLDRGTPIKEDTYADIELLGITGLKIIELRGGTNESNALKRGDYIRSGQSTTEMITGKAETMMEKAELMLNNLAILTNPENQEKLNALLDNTSSSMAILNKLLTSNEKELTNTLSNTEKITLDFTDLIHASKNTMIDIEKIVSSDSVRQIIDNMVSISENISQADLVKLVQELNSALSMTNSMLQQMDANINKTWVDFSSSIESIRESTEYLNQFSRMITEDPSLLVRGTKPKNVPDEKLED
jgi:phospholipid/cholesterol/gamma-HCH transport system substrate-binding protein